MFFFDEFFCFHHLLLLNIIQYYFLHFFTFLFIFFFTFFLHFYLYFFYIFLHFFTFFTFLLHFFKHFLQYFILPITLSYVYFVLFYSEFLWKIPSSIFSGTLARRFSRKVLWDDHDCHIFLQWRHFLEQPFLSKYRFFGKKLRFLTNIFDQNFDFFAKNSSKISLYNERKLSRREVPRSSQKTASIIFEFAEKVG